MADKKKSPESKKSLVDKIVDPIALGGLGAAAGIGGKTLYSYVKSDLKDPIYNPELTDVAKKEYYSSLKSKNKFFKSLLLAGAAGATLGSVAGIYKDEPLSNTTKALGATAALAGAKWLHGKRGTLHILNNNLDDVIDPWRGQTGIGQFFKSEKWVPNKNYDFKLDEGEVYSDRVQRAFLNNKKIDIDNLLKNYETKTVGTRNLDEALAQDIYSKGISEGKYGADPELNLVIKGKNKKLPVHLAIFPGDNYKKIPNLTNDFSVAGAEINNVPPGTPNELTKTLRDMEEAVKSRFEGTKVAIDPLSVVPLDSKNVRSYSRKTAGGHIHVGFDVQPGADEVAERLKLQKRLALILTPIDMTHPAMPVRSELYGKVPTKYGSDIIDKRALDRASWTPHGGFTDPTTGKVVRSNMEIRTAPSYIGDSVALNHKLKLIELALKHPNAHKLDELADQIYTLSNNSSKNLYNKDIAKLHTNGLRKILAEDMNVQDDWYENILNLRDKGGFREIGR